jgi:fatty acid amide hydrolase
MPTPPPTNRPALPEDPTRLGAVELAARIRSRALSAEEVVAAHLQRIDAVNQRLNAVVVRRFDEALAEARAADAQLAAGGPIPPLHGVPITIKESFDVAGTPTTGGIPARRDHRAERDSPLVARLRAAGAIVVGKTNVAQLLFFVESSNTLYGRTSNPWDLTRTAGGSSGGEAAIIAAGGSPLGLGSDIGGSVRIPAHFCGISAIKPTAHRLPPLGSINFEIGPQEAVVDSAGLLARRVEDLALALSVVAAPGLEAHDPALPPVPLADPSTVEPRRLRVGFFVDDGYHAATPALARAVREAADALSARGATLVEWRPPDGPEAVRLFAGLLGADGTTRLRQLTDGSAVDPNIRMLTLLGPRRPAVRRFVARLLESLGQRRMGVGARSWGRVGVAEYWRLLEERRAFRARFFAALDEARLDALLCPPMPGAAFPHGFNNRIGISNHYCLIANLLGLPAGVVAATRVRPGEEVAPPANRPRDVGQRALDEAERGSAGLPVGVQVMARHYQDHLVLALMAELESHFRTLPDHPTAPQL